MRWREAEEGEVEGGVWMMEEWEGGGRAGSLYSQISTWIVSIEFPDKDRTRKHVLKYVESRPSKCLSHHNQRLCKIVLAGVNLLFQTYGVQL